MAANGITIHGTRQWFSPPNPVHVRFDPVRGLIVEQDIVCAGDNLAGWANILMNEGIAFEWTRGALMSKMHITYSGGQLGLADNDQVNWQIQGNEIQNSIFESGLAKNLEINFAGSLNYIRALFDALQSGKLSGASLTKTKAEDFLTGDGLDDDVALDDVQWSDMSILLGFLTRGQTHFASGQWVLKGTVSISRFSRNGSDEGGAEGLYATSQILNFGLPGPIYNSVSSIPTPGSDGDYAWSWRRLPSTSTTTAQNKVEVSTEWWFGEWSTILYHFA